MALRLQQAGALDAAEALLALVEALVRRLELWSDGDSAPPGPDKNSKAETPRPSVQARVAAAALRLQRAGEFDATQALLTLVAGDAAAPVAKSKNASGRVRNAPWQAEAKRLRAQSPDWKTIPAEPRSQPLARWARDKNGERISGRQPVNASPLRPAVHYRRNNDEAAIRSKREIRAVLPPQEVKMGAIKRFAAGEITADELRRVLRTCAQPPPRGDPTQHRSSSIPP